MFILTLISTPILTFQFPGCGFFRVKNPEQGAAKIREVQSEQEPGQNPRPSGSDAEGQPNLEVARHRKGIDDLRAELARLRAELDELRSIVDGLNKENGQGF